LPHSPHNAEPITEYVKTTLQLAFPFSNDKLARMKNIVSQLVLFILAIFLIACSGGQDVPDQNHDEPHTNTSEGENPEEEEE
jgi:hypothetical protein